MMLQALGNQLQEGSWVLCSACQVQVSWSDIELRYQVRHVAIACACRAAMSEESARRPAKEHERRLHTQRHMNPADAKKIRIESIP